MIQYKTVTGAFGTIKLISGDGLNWTKAEPAPTLPALETERRALLFEAPVLVKRPLPRKKIVVKHKRTKRLMNAPVATLRKKAKKQAIADAIVAASQPRCTLVHADKPIKPVLTRGGSLNLVHVYSDVYNHIDREWFRPAEPGGTGFNSAASAAALIAKRSKEQS